jgi:hypothetical protein
MVMTLSVGMFMALPKSSSASGPSPTKFVMRTRSRRSLKKVLERSAPEPTPTKLHERMM